MLLSERRRRRHPGPSCFTCESGACGPRGARRTRRRRRRRSLLKLFQQAALGRRARWRRRRRRACRALARPPPMIEVGLRCSRQATTETGWSRRTAPARTAVVRVSTLAVPRLDMKPAPPPMPSPPPSDFCSSTTRSAPHDHQVNDDNDSLHFYLPSQTKAPGSSAQAAHDADIEFAAVLHDRSRLFHPRARLAVNTPRSQGNRRLSGSRRRPARH